jgi:predicted glutamine amidotransferase
MGAEHTQRQAQARVRSAVDADMCRLAAYLGEAIFLDEVIVKPSHSLLNQARECTMAAQRTQGDGWGLGWYGERPEPGLLRDDAPAWSDSNLLAAAQTMRSHLFMAHVRAATAGEVTRSNCHPFAQGSWLFMHNGSVGGFASLRRTLESWLSDELYAVRRGSTDSELLFLLILQMLRQGLPPPAAGLAVFEAVTALMREEGVDAPLRFAAVLADGQRLWAFRLASDDQPPTLYLRRMSATETSGRSGGTLVASEPLCGKIAAWTELPAGAVVAIDAHGPKVVRHRGSDLGGGSLVKPLRAEPRPPSRVMPDVVLA